MNMAKTIASFLVASLLVCGAEAFAQNGTQVASLNSMGDPADDSSTLADLSADARFLVFVSGATNLVAGDTNDTWDVFVRDLIEGTTDRVSVSSSGIEGNDHCHKPSISNDGRFVAFQSAASNLVSSDTNGFDDVFVHDRETGQTTRVSVSSQGGEGNGTSGAPSISGDGRYVVFQSSASNLVPGDLNDEDDVFLYDRVTAELIRVSVGHSGEEGDDMSFHPAISEDGRWIAFASQVSWDPADDNDSTDVYVYDVVGQALELVSVDSTGQVLSSSSNRPSISGDGLRIAFDSNNAFDPNDDNNRVDVYLRDRSTSETVRVSVDSQGLGGAEQSGYSTISRDGRFVAFETWCSLVEDDLSGFKDVYRRDVDEGHTVRVSLSVDLSEPDAYCDRPTISADGRTIGFISGAGNLIHGSEFDGQDVFVRDMGSCGWVRFREFGEGLEGSGGHRPYLAGVDGDCGGSYAMIAAGGLGGTYGIVWLGVEEAEVPLFGGTFYLDFSRPIWMLPVTLSGVPGAEGQGGLVLTGFDISAISGQHFFMQMTLLDPGAPRGVSMTNALEFWLR